MKSYLTIGEELAEKRRWRWIITFWAICFVVGIISTVAIWAGGAYVVAHFISKWW